MTSEPNRMIDLLEIQRQWQRDFEKSTGMAPTVCHQLFHDVDFFLVALTLLLGAGSCDRTRFISSRLATSFWFCLTFFLLSSKFFCRLQRRETKKTIWGSIGVIRYFPTLLECYQCFSLWWFSLWWLNLLCFAIAVRWCRCLVWPKSSG